MTYAAATFRNESDMALRMPPWLGAGRAETSEDLAFLSGAALAHLHLVLAQGALPHALLRARLALRAAENCVAHAGRPERAGELRDVVVFLPPGHQPGPAGEVYLSWRRAVERPLSARALPRALPKTEPPRIAAWLDAGQGAPIRRAASALQAVLEDSPGAEATALLIADAVLARALGWSHLTPLLSLGLKRRDLRKTGEELRLACHRAVAEATREAAREAAELGQRAARLHAVAPKLRARGAEEAVRLFLTRDAVAPTALTSLRSGRAARRFCDRLVALGAARELTGRDTFRLYGV